MSNLRRRRRMQDWRVGMNVAAATADTGYETYGESGGRLFLPAATNLSINPVPVHTADQVPAGGAPYNATNSTYTWSNGAAAGRGVSKHVRVVGGAGCSGYAAVLFKEFVNSEVAAGDVITGSAYISEAVLTGCTVGLSFSFWKDNGEYVTGVNSSAISVSANRTRFSYSYTVPALATKIRFGVSALGNFSEGDVVELSYDSVLVEKSSVLTPYFDGSTADSLNASTYAWTGTENASTSTRAASVLSIPSPWATVPAAGTIAGRGSPLGVNTAYTSEVIAGLFNGATALVEMGHKAGKRNFKVGTEATSTATFSAGSVNCSVGRWDAAGTYLTFNGTAASAGAAPTTGGAIALIKIGPQGAYYLGPKLFSAAKKSDAWVTAVDALLRGTISEDTMKTLKATYMDPGDALFTGLQRDGSNLYVRG